MWAGDATREGGTRKKEEQSMRETRGKGETNAIHFVNIVKSGQCPDLSFHKIRED